MTSTDPSVTMPNDGQSDSTVDRNTPSVAVVRDMTTPENANERATVPHVWVMCRRVAATGAVDNIRAYDDEVRAQADLDLAEAVSGDEFWLSAVPLLSGEAGRDSVTSVQRLALTWLAQGAEAEVAEPDTDPVVISPRHVRGFVSVPPEEWRQMEQRGWVRDGMITADGKAQIRD